MKRLTELEWSRVFEIRCRTKRGQTITDDERALVVAAHAQDRERYATMSAAVFEATKPFGSVR